MLARPNQYKKLNQSVILTAKLSFFYLECDDGIYDLLPNEDGIRKPCDS